MTTTGAATAPTLDGLHLVGASADSWEVVETEQVGTIRMANGAVREQRLALLPSSPVIRRWYTVTLDYRHLGPLAGGDGTFGHRRRDRSHRLGDIGYVRDRRQIEMHGAVAARRDDTVEAQPQRQGVAAEGKRHGLAGQRLGFAVEQCLSGARRMVPASGGSPGRVAGLALDKVPLRGPLRLILQEGIRHG